MQTYKPYIKNTNHKSYYTFLFLENSPLNTQNHLFLGCQYPKNAYISSFLPILH